ncbi:zeta toxin family protein [Microbacterium yannicii]|uniref:zeta toxin family protein n=1 Tax=Microbacterium yannicii TaxID=671622 RepID=UPI0003080F9F|nr:zeta toxin family protein [Microbacterium yannicii]
MTADVDVAAHDQILRRDILPLYFPDTGQGATPTFTLVAGQPGAGRARISSALARESGDGTALLNGEELRAFYPGFVSTSTNIDPEAEAALARAVSGWVSASIRYAREQHRSLVLEGTFGNGAAAAGTARRFAEAGFTTRLVVVGSRRAESLLSVTSKYLRDVQAGRAGGLISRQAHDEAFAATRNLMASVEDGLWVDRLTVVGRDGQVLFDGDQAGASGFVGAGRALAEAQSAPMGRFDATQWLSELHHLTDFAATRRQLPNGVAELLVDLHETSLREVIPQLHVPAGGRFATAMEQKTVASLVALRKTVPLASPVDAAAPVLVPGGPERGGVSR